MPSETPSLPSPSLLLSIPEVCETTRLGRRKIWELTNCGELPIVRVGRRVLIPRADLERWIESKREGGGT